jgi:hypothetical protein
MTPEYGPGEQSNAQEGEECCDEIYPDDGRNAESAVNH